MDLNFSLLRTPLFLACLAAFWYLGGYRYPIDPEALVNGRQAGQIWLLAHLLYVAGAGSFVLIDHRIGEDKGINLRPVYALVGLGMMTAAVIWLGRLTAVVPLM